MRGTLTARSPRRAPREARPSASAASLSRLATPTAKRVAAHCRSRLRWRGPTKARTMERRGYGLVRRRWGLKRLWQSRTFTRTISSPLRTYSSSGVQVVPAGHGWLWVSHSTTEARTTRRIEPSIPSPRCLSRIQALAIMPPFVSKSSPSSCLALPRTQLRISILTPPLAASSTLTR